ncbi:hypothetical protein DFH09DRAFT_1087581 [Mycena vulgaris]|nr:hypothetical protein DFH09DRAFT_1087581 [Mycena vulgaris]
MGPGILGWETSGDRVKWVNVFGVSRVGKGSVSIEYLDPTDQALQTHSNGRLDFDLTFQLMNGISRKSAREILPDLGITCVPRWSCRRFYGVWIHIPRYMYRFSAAKLCKGACTNETEAPGVWCLRRKSTKSHADSHYIRCTVWAALRSGALPPLSIPLPHFVHREHEISLHGKGTCRATISQEHCTLPPGAPLSGGELKCAGAPQWSSFFRAEPSTSPFTVPGQEARFAVPPLRAPPDLMCTSSTPP